MSTQIDPPLSVELSRKAVIDAVNKRAAAIYPTNRNALFLELQQTLDAYRSSVQRDLIAQVQRYLKHDDGCDSERCAHVDQFGVCEGYEVYHGYNARIRHTFRAQPCSCGLAAISAQFKELASLAPEETPK